MYTLESDYMNVSFSSIKIFFTLSVLSSYLNSLVNGNNT